MPLQRRLLHAMLALLGLAALAGVSTIFLPGREFSGRVAMTLFAAAVALGILTPASKKLERQDERSGGIFIFMAVVVGFCLALGTIWCDYFISRLTEELGLTTIAYIACIVPAGIFLALRRRPAGVLACYVGLAMAGLCFLLMLGQIWTRQFSLGWSVDKLGMTVGLLAGGAAPLCASLYGTLNDGKSWRWIGVGAALLAIAMGFYGVWIKSSNDATWFVQAFIVAGAVGGLNVMFRLPLRAGQRWLAFGTGAMLILTALSASFANVESDGLQNAPANDLTMRLFSAGSIVTACGVLAICVLLAFNRRVLATEARSLADITEVALSCPRCASRQRARVPESRCEGCGLIFLLKFAEPRCQKCNYSLLDIKGGVCPECGEPIVASPSAMSMA